MINEQHQTDADVTETFDVQDEFYDTGEEVRDYYPSWEWYLIFCFTLLIIEGFFNSQLGRALEARESWLVTWMPWNILPSDLYFYTVGLLFGLVLMATGPGVERIPSKGKFAFFLLWVSFSLFCAYGAYVQNPDWHRDYRIFMLPALVVPWTIVIAHRIRMNVVMNRIITISVFFAVANMIRGILFFKAGGRTVEEEALSSGSWQSDFCLLLPYTLALARSMTGQKGSKLSVVLLAIGILAPLHKQTLAIFLAANLFLLFLVLFSGRGNVKLSKTILTFGLLGFVGMAFGAFLLSLSGGAARDFLYERILKSGRREELESGSGRMEIWRTSLYRWTKKPVFGEGLGAAHLSSTYAKGLSYVPVHNFAIQLLMQTGVVGFTIVFINFLLWMVRALRTVKIEPEPDVLWVRLGLISYVVALLITCLFGYYLAARCVSYMFWFVIALEIYSYSKIYYYGKIAASEIVYEESSVQENSYDENAIDENEKYQ